MRIASFIRLCRPEQYYKNLVIFLAIFFSGNMLNLNHIFLVIGGFISLSLMSSANYIINDIIDKNEDKHNKEKSNRPLASGEVKVYSSIVFAFILFLVSITTAYLLNFYFLVMDLSFFLLSSFYSFFLKKELFADIIIISINFVIRALSGAFIINVWISPWLIIGAFFLALFLAVGKRRSEQIFLGKSAEKHRAVLGLYSTELFDSLMQISTTSLLLSYALYCFLGNKQRLLFTLPIMLYIVLRYLYLIYSDSDKPRMPNKIFKDYRMLFGIIVYIIFTFLILYFDNIAAYLGK